MRTNRQPGKASSVRLAVLSALLIMQPIAAWAEPAGVRYQVNQPSQPLSDALKSIAKQTHSSVLFDPGVVGQRLSQPVAGEFSGAEAISRALEGTGLTSEVMKDGSIVVKPGAELSPAQVVPARGVRSSYESADWPHRSSSRKRRCLCRVQVTRVRAGQRPGARSNSNRKGSKSPGRASKGSNWMVRFR
jgi:hypothetical protein